MHTLWKHCCFTYSQWLTDCITVTDFTCIMLFLMLKKWKISEQNVSSFKKIRFEGKIGFEVWDLVKWFKSVYWMIEILFWFCPSLVCSRCLRTKIFSKWCVHTYKVMWTILLQMRATFIRHWNYVIIPKVSLKWYNNYKNQLRLAWSYRHIWTAILNG